MELWIATAAAHGLIALAYVAIATIVGRGLTRTQQWSTNPLGTATFAIFATCALGHAIHVWHAFATPWEPAETVAAARIALGDWPLITWSIITAVVAAIYLVGRRRLAVLHGGKWMAVDVARRQAEAHEVQADVLARVKVARDKLRQGDTSDAINELEDALASSKRIVADLLPRRHEMRPGSVRRRLEDD